MIIEIEIMVSSGIFILKNASIIINVIFHIVIITPMTVYLFFIFIALP